MTLNSEWDCFVVALNQHDIDEAVRLAWVLHNALCKPNADLPDRRPTGITRGGLLVLLTSMVGYFDDPDTKRINSVQRFNELLTGTKKENEQL
jgi:hypothetical protein